MCFCTKEGKLHNERNFPFVVSANWHCNGVLERRMVKLSVIICVYNTDSDMLEQCLKSVRGGLTDTEIIVVDDGSAVSYAQLVQSFGAKYVRTENCGTLHARLLGVSLAQGQYVAFVDADDEVSFCYHSALCAVAERENADIVLGDWAFLTPKTAYVCQNDSTIKETFVTSDCLQRYFQHAGQEHSWYVLWNKVFRRTLLQQACQQVQMHPIGRQVFAEDVLITFFAFLYASRVANVHLGYYFYRLHASQQTNVNSFERFSAHVSQSAFVFDVMRSELEKLPQNDILLDKLDEWKNFSARSLYSSGKGAGFPESKQFVQRAFGLKEVKKATFSDDKAYRRHMLLPQNTAEIDGVLQQLCRKKQEAEIFAQGVYSRKTVLALSAILHLPFRLCDKHSAKVVLPREKYSAWQKILHGSFAFFVATALFPKGSRLRRLLKQKL